MKRSGKRFLLTALTALLMGLMLYAPVQTASAQTGPFVSEVIVRTVANFKNHNDVVSFVNNAAKRNISVINLAVKQDEDDEVPSGYVFYKSKIAPIAPGYANFDAVKDVIAEAHKKNIQVRAWIPQFHDRAAFDKNSEWQMRALVGGNVVPFTGSNGSEYFVNPLHPDVQAYERSIIREVASNYDIDGVVLDWIRFDDYNMDMGNYTRAQYMSQYGYDPITISFASDHAKRKEWNEWRTTKLGEYVRDVRSDLDGITPGLFFGAYILPPEFVECGQDVAKFMPYMDFIAPMAYFDDWDFPPSWVYDATGILSQTRQKTGGAEIIATLDTDWTDAQYHNVHQGIRANFPEISNLAFFVYGKWTDNEMKKINNRASW
ncbi:family 10 glycosylhydrolase [Paenibacillus donghaensis]|uniref:family 10 glycosylhydrolase n=1 Tax=Paenibacillus donghaensis TaxID=414771 RepID=UPI0018837D0C|nr:family 10 glycosylhydrolase [Paenibacillus donghaensis]MBE9912505.1 family 10 glycosylhydrolase [Paenibacillus donghaensis]